MIVSKKILYVETALKVTHPATWGVLSAKTLIVAFKSTLCDATEVQFSKTFCAFSLVWKASGYRMFATPARTVVTASSVQIAQNVTWMDKSIFLPSPTRFCYSLTKVQSSSPTPRIYYIASTTALCNQSIRMSASPSMLSISLFWT